MPPKSGAKQSRSALLVKLASEVAEPMSAVEALLHFVPDPNRRSSMPAKAETTGGDRISSDDSMVTDQGGEQQQQQDQQAQEQEQAEQPLVAGPSSITVRHFTSAQLPQAILEWAFKIVKDSVKALYEPVWGWSDAKKMTQLKGATSRFIVAFRDGPQGETPVGYVNYRLEQYDGKPACYLYEVMVEASCQRMGLGTRLMRIAEEMAWSLRMERCVLTEFAANKTAAAFYRKLGYRTDSTSPKNPSCGYIILSKGKPTEA